MNVCVIPARSGSKRIPGKNIKPFCGRPVIAWSISAALSSGCFDKIVVSTDHESIAEVALDNGAEVPFLRPKELSDDYTPTVPVVAHAIKELFRAGYAVENVCCLYATAPLVQASRISEGLQLIGEGYVVSVARFSSPIQRALVLNDEGGLSMLNPEFSQVRSQDLKEAWHDAGQFYWGKSKTWLEKEDILKSVTAGVLLAESEVQDIDTEEDWLLAELKWQRSEILNARN